MDLLEQIERNIRHHRLLAPGDKIVVAVSGGVDSVVLLDSLHRLAAPWRWTLIVAHLNHQLRGDESDRDQDLVESLARDFASACLAERADVSRRQRQNGLSLEMAARQLRHEFLARAAAQCGASIIALGHHANDQLELFWLRLLRGAGGLGLRGMQWQSPSPTDPARRLIRPLLDLPKAVLESHARHRGLRFAADSSNADPSILRNKIRLELIPLLISQYQPRLLEQIRKTMEIAGDESEVILDMARKWLSSRKRPPFAAQPAAVQRRILWLQLLSAKIEPRFEWIEALREQPETAITLGPAHCFRLSQAGDLLPVKKTGDRFNPAQADVQLVGQGGETHFGQHLLRWQRIPCPPLSSIRKKMAERELYPSGHGQEFFDAEKIGPSLVVRYWRPGDRFRPMGMTCPVKLQDLLTNQKIPRAERRSLLLATSVAGDLFWVQGLRPGDVYKLDKNTQTCLKWEWHRITADPPSGETAQ